MKKLFLKSYIYDNDDIECKYHLNIYEYNEISEEEFCYKNVAYWNIDTVNSENFLSIIDIDDKFYSYKINILESKHNPYELEFFIKPSENYKYNSNSYIRHKIK